MPQNAHVLLLVHNAAPAIFSFNKKEPVTAAYNARVRSKPQRPAPIVTDSFPEERDYQYFEPV